MADNDMFFTIISGLNIFLGTTTIILFFIFIASKKIAFPFQSKNLKLFILTCCCPQALIITICSMGLGLYYLTTENTDTLEYRIGRLIITFASYQLRFSILTILTDRIIATIFLEKYAAFSSKRTVWTVITVSAYIISLIFQIPTILWIFNKDADLYAVTNYNVIFIHSLTLITCKFLHSKNQKLYKMLVYNISLKQRYQILENIKVLNILWPHVLTLSICGFFGPFISSFYVFFTVTLAPSGVNHIFYNISFIIIIIRILKSKVQKSKIVSITGNQFILSPLGNNLPANISNDLYFKDLKQQWN